MAKQIAMLKKLIDILNKINEGTNKEDAIASLTKSELKIFKFYLDSIQ